MKKGPPLAGRVLDSAARRLLIRAFIPQICLALLLACGLGALAGDVIIYHRMWISAPPVSAELPGGPRVNNSAPLQDLFPAHRR